MSPESTKPKGGQESLLNFSCRCSKMRVCSLRHRLFDNLKNMNWRWLCCARTQCFCAHGDPTLCWGAFAFAACWVLPSGEEPTWQNFGGFAQSRFTKSLQASDLQLCQGAKRPRFCHGKNVLKRGVKTPLEGVWSSGLPRQRSETKRLSTSTLVAWTPFRATDGKNLRSVRKFPSMNPEIRNKVKITRPHFEATYSP